MTVHVVAILQIHDPEGLARYGAVAGEAVARHGGRLIGGASAGAEMLENTAGLEASPVLLSFPSADHARAWINDPDLADVHALRQGAAKTTIMLLNAPG